MQEIASGSQRLHHIKYKLQGGETQPKYIAPPETRDKVYREFLKLLQLNEEHKADLLRPSLSKVAIRAKGYKTLFLEKEKRFEICRTLQAKGYGLEGIPGFFKHKTIGEWDYKPYQGYAIPVRNFERQIVGLLVGMNEPALSKYRWFSSSNSKNVGTPAEANLYFTGGCTDGVVYITEGALKGDVAAYLSGKMSNLRELAIIC
ncbi:hypothetical protein [Caldicellulosiruptor kronotskyensis]|uniref:hypothetical protein n=1 Tax=Caldicellulosiruptor kronotskyensis TaxID=413889 RepID=UPI0001E9A646|nr:hypothetical protein [Caldicellulosiruptor kronotskyensis]